ncbi:hypothetical protein D4764_14G0002390 [Takifugu flavidus]|uniref:Uncharacterized protein n=1 Tax=Takifugu flavidus TaxID=433684 RepID=A0A5C6P5W1_9TELE|nr:hypothetical protein D4764_14G0002390 [Takifugu flavidus]
MKNVMETSKTAVEEERQELEEVKEQLRRAKQDIESERKQLEEMKNVMETKLQQEMETSRLQWQKKDKTGGAEGKSQEIKTRH